MKRRHFIHTTSAAAAAAILLPSFACSREKKTGLILYTVRQEMNEDAEATLDKVAELGFNWLEAASYSEGKFYGRKPSEIRSMIESRGMQLISSHNGMNYDNYEQIIGDCAEAGMKYTVMPSLGRQFSGSVDNFIAAAEFMNIAGEKCREHGLKLGFHNHQVEFKAVDGQIPFEILADNTEDQNLIFELDLAWISASGNDPIDYFKKYPGRFELIHVKDLSRDKRDATLGEGTIDFVPIFENVKAAGMKYWFIEQDHCQTHTPFESIEISRNFLLENILI